MRYQEVVEKAQKAERKGTEKVPFWPCETWLAGDQINLWTYWQGYQLKDIDDNGVDILLVGQDWGNPWREGNKSVISGIRDIQAGKEYSYETNSATDLTMARMVKTFGENINIMANDPRMRLFFTNYSLGYRCGSETGGMTKTIMKQDKELFDDLVLSIHPKIIICLGRITYEMVSGTIADGFVDRLKKGKPFKSVFPLDESIPVYGVAHCGARGRNNVGGEDNMKKAWMVIAEEYKLTVHGTSTCTM